MILLRSCQVTSLPPSENAEKLEEAPASLGGGHRGTQLTAQLSARSDSLPRQSRALSSAFLQKDKRGSYETDADVSA